jgi:hypothetical protein
MLLLTVAIIGYGGYREWDASQKLAASLQNLRTDETNLGGVPDFNTFFSPIAENVERYQAWSKLIDLSKNSFAGLSYLDTLPVIGGDSRAVFPIDQPWKEEPLVAETLDYLRPILDQLEVAVQQPLPDPAWFDSTSRTHRPSTYSLIEQAVKVQQLEIVHALYHRDRQRILHGLEVLSILEKRGKDHWFTADVTNVVKSICRTILCNSLDFDLWSVDDLDRFKASLVQPSNVKSEIDKAAQSYRRSTIAQLAKNWREINLFINEPLRRVLYNLPSPKLAAIEEADQLVERTRNGTLLTNYLSQQTPFRQIDFTNSARWSLFRQRAETAWFEKYTIRYLVDHENFRRLVLTAITVKQYQLEKGEWPKQLSDLQTYGLTSQDYTSVAGNRFGFEVTPHAEVELANQEHADSKDIQQSFACLWIPAPDVLGAAPSSVDSRPTFHANENRGSNQNRVIRIR